MKINQIELSKPYKAFDYNYKNMDITFYIEDLKYSLLLSNREGRWNIVENSLVFHEFKNNFCPFCQRNISEEKREKKCISRPSDFWNLIKEHKSFKIRFLFYSNE